MELVEGDDLSVRIARGRLAVPTLLTDPTLGKPDVAVKGEFALQFAVPAPNLSAITPVVSRVLRARPEVRVGWVFGSTVTGRTRPTSDIDLAVLLSDRAARGDHLRYRLGLLADLAAALHSDAIDVVILNSAPPALAQNVLRHGIVVSERSKADRVRFQVRTLNRFVDTQPLRDQQWTALRTRYVRGRRRG